MSTMTPTTAMSKSNVDSDDLPPLWKTVFGAGVLLAAVGVAAMSLSWATAIAVELLIGAAMTAVGIVQAALAIQSRGQKGVVWIGVSALLFLIGGVFLLASPIEGVRTISLLIAILFVVEGVGRIVSAFTLPTYFNRPTLMVEGLVGTGLGLFFWTNWPGDAGWMIGLLVGIRCLVAGIAMASMGWMMRPSRTNAA
jgi:uncharacterized membrane protein HdeD (DUF308 family)